MKKVNKQLPRSTKLTIVYSNGKTHEVSQVNDYGKETMNDKPVLFYSHAVNKTHGVYEERDVYVSLEDVLYVAVRKPDDFVTLIPGLISKFDIVPNGNQMKKVNETLEYQEEVSRRREATRPERAARELAKREARENRIQAERAERKVQYTLPAVAVAPAKVRKPRTKKVVKTDNV